MKETRREVNVMYDQSVSSYLQNLNSFVQQQAQADSGARTAAERIPK
ncbi:hypothetical protein AAHB36_05510 [Bacillus velezensis]